MRLQLTLETLEPDQNATRIDLSQCHLSNLNALRPYARLQTLILTGNKLTVLDGQGLEHLLALERLDVRNNSIVSLENLLNGCASCDRLAYLSIHNATADGKTTKIGDALLVTVCDFLRGLKELDGRASPIKEFDPNQNEALNFLYMVCGVGINHLRNVNISRQGLHADLFFFILAALGELRCVRTLQANFNGWNIGQHQAYYRQYVIASLGPQLGSLDGEVVTEAERQGSFSFVERDGENKIQSWKACKDLAYRMARQRPSKPSQSAAAEERPSESDRSYSVPPAGCHLVSENLRPPRLSHFHRLVQSRLSLLLPATKRIRMYHARFILCAANCLRLLCHLPLQRLPQCHLSLGPSDRLQRSVRNRVASHSLTDPR